MLQKIFNVVLEMISSVQCILSRACLHFLFSFMYDITKCKHFRTTCNIKCGFPLAEERKKRKTLFSHKAGSLGTGVRGVSGYVACVRFQFLFCHLPLPDMPYPPTCEELVDCVKLR